MPVYLPKVMPQTNITNNIEIPSINIKNKRVTNIHPIITPNPKNTLTSIPTH